MSDLPTANSPIVIDRVERSRGDGDAVRLRLGGHRLAVAAGPELDALLVVQVHGHRHRFAASKTKHGDTSPGSWEASFTVPDWAVPVEYGQASLWVGEASVPVPPVGTRIRVPEPALTAAPYEPTGAAQLDAALHRSHGLSRRVPVQRRKFHVEPFAVVVFEVTQSVEYVIGGGIHDNASSKLRTGNE